jgi:hypothetical protein
MMPFHHSWGSHASQTASHIHIRHINRVWGIGMPSQEHMDAPLYHPTSQVGNRFWNIWSSGEWEWCNVIMVKANIHLGVYPTSILDIYKVFEVLVCCLKGIWLHPYFIPPAKLASDFWNSGSLVEWKWCHCMMVEADIHLRLLLTSI